MGLGTPAGYVVGQEFNPYKQFKVICIPEPVFLYRGLSQGAKLLYGRLMRYAGEDGKAFPAIGTLAAELQVSVRQVQRYLQELSAKRFIRILPQDGKTNHYKFLWHEAFDVPMTSVSPLPSVETPPPLIKGGMTSVPPLPMTSVSPKESQCKRVNKELAGQTRAREELNDDSYAREEFRLVVLDATKAGSISPQLATRMYTSAVKSTLPMDMMHQYMYDVCKEKRELGDPIGPPVLALALEEKRYMCWLQKTANRNLLERYMRKREEREYLESLRKPPGAERQQIGDEERVSA